MTTKPKTLTLQFANAKDRDDFVAWFLDAGGDQQFGDFRDMHSKPVLNAKPPAPQTLWDWALDPDADNHVIAMTPCVDGPEGYDYHDGDPGEGGAS